MAELTCERHPHGSVQTIRVEEYPDHLMGVPVILLHSVEQKRCKECNAVLATMIPDQEGLMAAIAVVRINDPLKLDGAEVRFLRKTLGKTGKQLAHDLEVTPETVSRWENGKEPIGPTSEKLLRLIVGDALCDTAPAIDYDPAEIVHMRIQPIRSEPGPLVLVMELVDVKLRKQPLRPHWGETGKRHAA